MQVQVQDAPWTPDEMDAVAMTRQRPLLGLGMATLLLPLLHRQVSLAVRWLLHCASCYDSGRRVCLLRYSSLIWELWVLIASQVSRSRCWSRRMCELLQTGSWVSTVGPLTVWEAKRQFHEGMLGQAMRGREAPVGEAD